MQRAWSRCLIILFSNFHGAPCLLHCCWWLGRAQLSYSSMCTSLHTYILSVCLIKCPEFQRLCLILCEGLVNTDIPGQDKMREAIMSHWWSFKPWSLTFLLVWTVLFSPLLSYFQSSSLVVKSVLQQIFGPLWIWQPTWHWLCTGSPLTSPLDVILSNLHLLASTHEHPKSHLGQ